MIFEVLLLLTLEFGRRKQYKVFVMKKLFVELKLREFCVGSGEPFPVGFTLVVDQHTVLCCIGSLTKLKSTMMMFSTS
jgi:hypothetical protein